jgi:acyl-CoA synthetase (AMP-forming)/AMP-acid ligase II
MIMQYDVSGIEVRLSQELIRKRVEKGEWPNRTIVDLARDLVREAPRKVLVIEGESRLTVAEIFDRSMKLASSFVASGFKPGDVIAMQVPNWVETTIIYLATAMTGLIFNPILPILRDSEVKFMLADSRSRLIFIPRQFRGFDYLEMMRRLAPDLPALEKIVVLRGDPGTGVAWQDYSAGSGEVPRLPEVDPNAVKIIMYTSGTTGRPKGVMHTHNTLQAEIRSFQKHWKLDSSDVVFMASPVTHVTGCNFAFEVPWATGAPVVLQEKWNPGEAVDLFREHGVTLTSSSTPFLRELLGACQARNEHLPAFKRFICGGMSIPPQLVRDAQAWFSSATIARCFGLSELSSITIGIVDRSQSELGAETDGIVDPLVRVRIVDPVSGAPLPMGVEGEILADAPELFVGYYRSEDNRNAFDEDGFFRTGDIGKLTKDNCLIITGRKKDLIIRGGENLSPVEIETALLQHPSVADVAVVAMPHERLGEGVACFIVPVAGATIDQAEVARFLISTAMARQKIPERVELIDALPRNTQGKVLKRELRERIQALCKQ